MCRSYTQLRFDRCFAKLRGLVVRDLKNPPRKRVKNPIHPTHLQTIPASTASLGEGASLPGQSVPPKKSLLRRPAGAFIPTLYLRLLRSSGLIDVSRSYLVSVV